MNKNKETNNKIIEAVLEGIRKIKGKDITIIDLNTVHHTECGYFIICHGTSSTQVSSIAQSVEETVTEITRINAWHTEGYRNSVWILLDYGDIVVHVFHEKTRSF
jgi:ribosome-associated protein